MKWGIKLLIWAGIASLCLGFRIFPGKWAITKSDPTIWIRLCNSTLNIEDNDLPDGDPLAGVSGLTYAQVIQSVIDDYNNVPTSFLRLALYPVDPNNPGTPAAGDSTFTINTAAKRTIDICFGETDPKAGLSGGYAQPSYEGRQLVGCAIKAKPEHARKAMFMTHLITHELGHCFGLGHPQEGTQSVMSYFYDQPFTRLQNDDDAGLTFGYPEDESYAKEAFTYGLTGCSPKG